MELMLMVWFASIVSQISAVLMVLGILLALVSIAFAFNYFSEKSPCFGEPNHEMATTYFKWFKVAVIASISCLLVALVTPKDEKTVYLMAGAYLAQQVITSDAGKKVAKIIELKLDELINEVASKGETK